MRSLFLSITLAFLIFAQWTGNALATNGYQLIGVGEGQKSMAGAVTAAPMDTMTVGGGDTNRTDLNFNWDSQIIYALGIQYRATDRLALRGGVNYAKSPIGEADVFNNLIFPAAVETHVALGFDYQYVPFSFSIFFFGGEGGI